MKTIGYALFLLFFSPIFAQITWLETSQADFADGYIDPNLYASFRHNVEAIGDSGAVEWFPRFDLDNNGYPDFVSSDFWSPFNVRVWFMGPSGLDHFAYFPNGAEGGNCDYADLNIDGYAELIHSGANATHLTIYWNDAGTLSASSVITLPNNGGESVYIADFNRDGYLDIAMGGASPGVLRLYWGMPGFTYSTSSILDIPLSTLLHNIESADFDNDGDLDIVTVGDGIEYFLESLGGSAFIDHTFISSPAVGQNHGVSVADLDKDGDVDIVFTGYSGAWGAEIFYNDGGFTFTRTTINAGSNYGGSALFDFDGDSWLDIIMFRNGAGPLYIYPNDGTGHFSDATRYAITPISVSTSGGTVVDANLDGNVDIFVNGWDYPYSLVLWGPDFTTCDSFTIAQDHHGIFREPGNIRDRSQSAFYESGIFDAGENFCSGSVSYIAYDERDYDSGALPEPIGTEVLILARTGDTPIPDALWTEWDTLADDSALPASILGHRYIQYRAELWYSNVAYLPWLEQIEFRLEPCDTTILIVELICPPQGVYIACDDQAIYFSVTMDSACWVDSSATWLVIDSTDSFTLDSTWLSLDSLLRFEPDTAYWESGPHWFQLHFEDDCGHEFDSLYGALFDLDPPQAWMLVPPIGAPNPRDAIPHDALTYDRNQDISIQFWDELSGVELDSICLRIQGQSIPFQ